jgi:hypothetical protein
MKKTLNLNLLITKVVFKSKSQIGQLQKIEKNKAQLDLRTKIYSVTNKIVKTISMNKNSLTINQFTL